MLRLYLDGVPLKDTDGLRDIARRNNAEQLDLVLVYQSALRAEWMYELEMHPQSWSLEKAPDEIRYDAEIVEIAIRASLKNLQYAPDCFRNNREFIIKLFDR